MIQDDNKNVIIPIRFFPHSWFTKMYHNFCNRYVTRAIREVSLVEQDLFTLLEHMSSPLGIVEFVLLNLLFSV